MKVKPLRISLNSSNVLRQLKDTPYWDAIKEYMVEYSRYKRDSAFYLNETSENFKIRHAREVSAVQGLVDFKRFIENEAGRESQSDV